MLRYVIISTIILTTLLSFVTIPAFADEQRTDLGYTGLNDFYFHDENTGWIVGDSGVLLRTTDGGSNWEELSVIIDSTEKLVNFNGVHFYDDKHGTIVGATNGVVYVTDDAGDSWAEQSATYGEITDANIINDVFMIDAAHAYLVSDKNYVAWYDGSDWDEYQHITDPIVNANRVFFIDDEYGWVVGDSSTMLTTIDVIGLGWSTPEVPEEDIIPGDYLDVFFTDRFYGWIITNDGLILSSFNGGQDWAIAEDKFSAETLHDIFFLDSNNGWIVGDNGVVISTINGGDTWSKNTLDASKNLIRVQYFENNGFILDTTGITRVTPSDETNPPKRSGGGCNDCTPPTLGLDKNSKRLVDNGFTYNGDSTQVGKYHTPYPLINATVGEINKVSIKVYENGGIYNMHRIQFGLGAEQIGAPLNSLEVLINVELLTDGTTTGVSVDKIVINDDDNLIDNYTVSATAFVVKCQSTDVTSNCVNVDLYYSYREATINHVMVVNVEDKKNNAQNFYFNDGVQVLGESLNESPTYTINNKQTSQQTDDLTLILTRVDKVNHIWIDNNGIEYLKISESRFDRVTPTELYSCPDDYIIKTVAKRTNICQFLPLLNYEIVKAENTMNAILSSNNLDTIDSWDHNNKALRQYE